MAQILGPPFFEPLGLGKLSSCNKFMQDYLPICTVIWECTCTEHYTNLVHYCEWLLRCWSEHTSPNCTVNSIATASSAYFFTVGKMPGRAARCEQRYSCSDMSKAKDYTWNYFECYSWLSGLSWAWWRQRNDDWLISCMSHCQQPRVWKAGHTVASYNKGDFTKLIQGKFSSSFQYIIPNPLQFDREI